MLWELKQGQTEKFLLEQAERSHAPIPDVILNKPRLLPGLVFYMKAFNDLQSERPVIVGASSAVEGQIPWRAAKEYALAWGLSSQDFSRMWTLLRRMDSVYINHKADDARSKAAVSQRTKHGTRDGTPAPVIKRRK